MRSILKTPLLALAAVACAGLALAQSNPRVQVVSPPAKAGAVKTAPGQPNLPPAQGGKLEVPAPSYDAGTIKRGEKITHSFVIKNTGTGVLNIHAKPG